MMDQKEMENGMMNTLSREPSPHAQLWIRVDNEILEWPGSVNRVIDNNTIEINSILDMGSHYTRKGTLWLNTQYPESEPLEFLFQPEELWAFIHAKDATKVVFEHSFEPIAK